MEVDSKDEALMIVLSFYKKNTKITKLCKFRFKAVEVELPQEPDKVTTPPSVMLFVVC